MSENLKKNLFLDDALRVLKKYYSSHGSRNTHEQKPKSKEDQESTISSRRALLPMSAKWKSIKVKFEGYFSFIDEHARDPPTANQQTPLTYTTFRKD